MLRLICTINLFKEAALALGLIEDDEHLQSLWWSMQNNVALSA